MKSKQPNPSPIEWKILPGLTEYVACVNQMEQTASAIYRGEAAEQVWLVEHPPLYTAGTSAKSSDLVKPERFDVHKTGRGGQYTYHGPGQRIAYVMLNLNARERDVRKFVVALENWVIGTLAQFNIKGEKRDGRVGVWVEQPQKPPLPDGSMREDKIAAIGIRLRRWVSFHGISINVEPELDHYSGIVPCGITGHGITSLVDLGLPVTMGDLDVVLKSEFEALFGETVPATVAPDKA